MCGVDCPVFHSAQALIAHGANVDARDDSNGTALMEASVEGHFHIVKALIAAGNHISKLLITIAMFDFEIFFPLSSKHQQGISLVDNRIPPGDTESATSFLPVVFV